MGIRGLTGEDLLHTVFCQVIEKAKNKNINRSYIHRTIVNFSINEKRKENTRYNPKAVDDEILDSLFGGTDELIDTMMQFEHSTRKNKIINYMKSAVREYLSKNKKVPKTVRKLLDETGNSFFLDHKTSELARRLELSASTITNNISWIRKNTLPFLKDDLKQYYGEIAST